MTQRAESDHAMDQEDPDEKVVSGEEVSKFTDTNEKGSNNTQFSSENFKIELQNLPKYFGMGQMKKLLNKKLNLNANKLKPCGSNFMFVCFRNMEDKEKALMILDGFTFKGNKLKAISAKAAVDPYQLKKTLPVKPDNRSIEQRIQDVVCPYAKLSYDQQLERKLSEIVCVVKRLGADISKTNPELTSLVNSRVKEHGTVAPIQEFIRSPITRGYRNKCEFSIGFMNTETKVTTEMETGLKKEEAVSENDCNSDDVITARSELNTAATISVGFRLATYKQGSIEVVSLSSLTCPEDVLPHISPQMIKIGVMFEQLVRASGILPYNSLTNQGNWRSIMIRSAGEDHAQLMVVVVLDPKELSVSQLVQVRSDLVTFFTEGAGGACKVTNLFLSLSPARKSQGMVEPQPELLSGDPVITEKLFDLSFSVSPQAFFQVNTKGAEELYRCVGDLVDVQDGCTLVDVCCGTGTIGLSLANRVKKVIGVELVSEAVRDARKNAENNRISNCSFFAGKAENILINVLKDIDSNEVVAVVDPPRAGLHHKALSAIRNNPKIRKLVFVSCDASAAMKNFVDLCRPASKTAKGDPFFPVKIVPVDMFPYVKQFELVLLFERVTEQEVLNAGDLSI